MVTEDAQLGAEEASPSGGMSLDETFRQKDRSRTLL